MDKNKKDNRKKIKDIKKKKVDLSKSSKKLPPIKEMIEEDWECASTDDDEASLEDPLVLQGNKEEPKSEKVTIITIEIPQDVFRARIVDKYLRLKPTLIKKAPMRNGMGVGKMKTLKEHPIVTGKHPEEFQ